MPFKPKRPCRHPGCKNLSDQPYCEEHRKENPTLRASASMRGYGYEWRKARSQYLGSHPICVKCYQNKRLTPATVVDHIVPHRGDEKLFWDVNNWQALCAACHNEKTGHGL